MNKIFFGISLTILFCTVGICIYYFPSLISNLYNDESNHLEIASFLENLESNNALSHILLEQRYYGEIKTITQINGSTFNASLQKIPGSIDEETLIDISFPNFIQLENISISENLLENLNREIPNFDRLRATVSNLLRTERPIIEIEVTTDLFNEIEYINSLEIESLSV